MLQRAQTRSPAFRAGRGLASELQSNGSTTLHFEDSLQHDLSTSSGRVAAGIFNCCRETAKMDVPPGNSSRGTAGLVPRRT
jgi:hypothetical protein